MGFKFTVDFLIVVLVCYLFDGVVSGFAVVEVLGECLFLLFVWIRFVALVLLAVG